MAWQLKFEKRAHKDNSSWDAVEVCLANIDEGQALVHSVLNQDVRVRSEELLLGLEWWARRIKGVILRRTIYLARYEARPDIWALCASPLLHNTHRHHTSLRPLNFFIPG